MCLRKYTLSTLLTVCFLSASPQSDSLIIRSLSQITDNSFSGNGWYRIREGVHIPVDSFLRLLRNESDLGHLSSLEVFKIERVPQNLDFVRTRYNQRFNGIKVEGRELSIHSNTGYVMAANGLLEPDSNLTLQTPVIHDSIAFQIAVNNWSNVIFAWDDTTSEFYNSPPIPELVYAVEEHTANMRGHLFRLAYRIDILLVHPFDESFAVYVDVV